MLKDFYSTSFEKEGVLGILLCTCLSVSLLRSAPFTSCPDFFNRHRINIGFLDYDSTNIPHRM